LGAAGHFSHARGVCAISAWPGDGRKNIGGRCLKFAAIGAEQAEGRRRGSDFDNVALSLEADGALLAFCPGEAVR
jgi:hypothetical protein